MPDIDELIDQANDLNSGGPQLVRPATGARRVTSLFARGATLGALGAKTPPRNIPESAAEFAGGAVPAIAASAVATPAAGAALRGIGVTSRLATSLAAAGGTGALVGGTEAVIKGENIPKKALETAGQFTLAEGVFRGAGKAVGLLRGARPAVEQVEEKAGAGITRKVVGQVDDAMLAVGKKEERTEDRESIATVKKAPTDFTTEELLKAGPEEITQDTDVRSRRMPTTQEIAMQRMAQLPRLETQGAIAMRRADELFDVKGPATVAINDDKFTTLVATPKNATVAKAVEIAKDTPPVPILTQQEIAKNRANDSVRQKLDISAQREPLTTSSLLKRTPEDVDRIVNEGQPAKLLDVKAIQLSDDALLVDSLVKKSGVLNNEIIEETIKKIPPGMSPEQAKEIFRRVLQEHCK